MFIERDKFIYYDYSDLKLNTQNAQILNYLLDLPPELILPYHPFLHLPRDKLMVGSIDGSAVYTDSYTMLELRGASKWPEDKAANLFGNLVVPPFMEPEQFIMWSEDVGLLWPKGFLLNGGDGEISAEILDRLIKYVYPEYNKYKLYDVNIFINWQWVHLGDDFGTPNRLLLADGTPVFIIEGLSFQKLNLIDNKYYGVLPSGNFKALCFVASNGSALIRYEHNNEVVTFIAGEV